MYLELMQFSAIILMVTLTLKLLLLPQRVVGISKINRSRWLLVAGTFLLSIQFLLQYLLHLRPQNVEAAIRLNLAFFIPCSALFSLAIINLQCQGFISRREKYLFIPVWIAAVAVSFWSMIAASILFAAMLLYYIIHQMNYMRMIRRAIANYFENDYDDFLKWMWWSIRLITMMAITVPVMIFVQGPLLAVFAIMFLMGIFYLIDCFTLYTVSNTPAKVMEAQQNEEANIQQQKNEEHLSDNALHRVELAVGNWIEKRGHLQTGLNLPNASEEIGVPRYLLSAWLKQKGLHYNDWLTSLRINEAKQVMLAHPEWSNETIAQHCGFSDRTYFQRKFKDFTGLTPNDFQSQKRT